jgi:hypothetical protein
MWSGAVLLVVGGASQVRSAPPAHEWGAAKVEKSWNQYQSKPPVPFSKTNGAAKPAQSFPKPVNGTSRIVGPQRPNSTPAPKTQAGSPKRSGPEPKPVPRVNTQLPKDFLEKNAGSTPSKGGEARNEFSFKADSKGQVGVDYKRHTKAGDFEVGVTGPKKPTVSGKAKTGPFDFGVDIQKGKVHGNGEFQAGKHTTLGVDIEKNKTEGVKATGTVTIRK